MRSEVGCLRIYADSSSLLASYQTDNPLLPWPRYCEPELHFINLVLKRVTLGLRMSDFSALFSRYAFYISLLVNENSAACRLDI